MVTIPAGAFRMGSDRVDSEGKGGEFGMAKPLYLDEHPPHDVTLPAYFIDRHEVTNADYQRFVRAANARPPKSWINGAIPAGREQYPVTHVNWYDAQQYCRWAGKRLPTEAEWEKAARGPDGREYPWGNAFDGKKANTGESGVGDLAPVGSFPQGKSPYGVEDMAGNVWEWTADWYQPYPGGTSQSKDFGQKFKVLRGGSWGGTGHYALSYFYRAAHRFFIAPEFGFADAGLRCAKSA
jgi:formylglycine-generating enzyme required for sulfatase activity